MSSSSWIIVFTKYFNVYISKEVLLNTQWEVPQFLWTLYQLILCLRYKRQLKISFARSKMYFNKIDDNKKKERKPTRQVARANTNLLSKF